MIYTDGIHLICDGNIEELHEFALSTGLKRTWFQDHGGHPHYDTIVERVMTRAIRHGAVMVTPKDVVRILNGLPPKDKCELGDLMRYRDSVPTLTEKIKKYSRRKSNNKK